MYAHYFTLPFTARSAEQSPCNLLGGDASTLVLTPQVSLNAGLHLVNMSDPADFQKNEIHF